jgi:lipopolysaccharide transport system permease protein
MVCNTALIYSVTFTIIFNNLAGISTGAVPPFLFNLAGITIWNYFTVSYRDIQYFELMGIFGKVYFPCIIVPISIVISNLLKFGIQF